MLFSAALVFISAAISRVVVSLNLRNFPATETAVPWLPDLRPLLREPQESGGNGAEESTQVEPAQVPVKIFPQTDEAIPAEPGRLAPEFILAGGRTERPKPEGRGTLVFVIDDAGNNLWELEPFLRFSGPLSIAVLPGLPYSAEAARRIRDAGMEVLLHQPMEAVGGKDPGPGAVYAGMEAEEIRRIISRNLDEIGPVAGMNNHQGSMVTMDIKVMETVLSLCRERGIIFLDSKTIAETAAPAAAKRLGIKIGERDVFLDNIQEKTAMIGCVNQGLEKANRNGSAVMIGHTWSAELAATLEELYPELIAQGYSLSTISRFVMGTEDFEDPGY